MLWSVVLENTLESPLDSKEIQPVHPKGNQSWIFTGRTDPEAEAPILWAPDVKSQLSTKDPDAGKNWSQEEKGMTEDEMFGWHHWLNGHKSEQAPGGGEGQGSLVCCSTQDHKELDMTERLNNNNNIFHDGRMLFLPKKNAVSIPQCTKTYLKNDCINAFQRPFILPTIPFNEYMTSYCLHSTAMTVLTTYISHFGLGMLKATRTLTEQKSTT